MRLPPARVLKIALAAATLVAAPAAPAAGQGDNTVVVVRAAHVLDGIGNDLGARDVVIRGDRIERIEPPGGCPRRGVRPG